jgi:hypothetical protein
MIKTSLANGKLSLAHAFESHALDATSTIGRQNRGTSESAATSNNENER